MAKPNSERDRITVQFATETVRAMDAAIERGDYAHRSELIRRAIYNELNVKAVEPVWTRRKKKEAKKQDDEDNGSPPPAPPVTEEPTEADDELPEELLGRDDIVDLDEPPEPPRDYSKEQVAHSVFGGGRA